MPERANWLRTCIQLRAGTVTVSIVRVTLCREQRERLPNVANAAAAFSPRAGGRTPPRLLYPKRLEVKGVSTEIGEERSGWPNIGVARDLRRRRVPNRCV